MLKQIKKIAAELAQNPQVKAVILYGSYAKGTQKPISDVDICVVTEKHTDENIENDVRGWSGPKIDVVLFWDLPTNIRYAVLREGKVLLVRDEDFLNEVTVETMSEYLDFRHIIDRSIARMVEA